MMSSLIKRWQDNILLMQVYDYVVDRRAIINSKAWYQDLAPKIGHPVKSEGEALDCRYIDLSHRKVGETPLYYIIDNGLFVQCEFTKTLFQSASAFYADFTGSSFLYAQMSPFYAHGAIFKDCIFDTCVAFGISPSKEQYGSYSDFTECDFTNVKAQKVGFDRCDFKQAQLVNGRFKQCDFGCSDFMGANLAHSIFESCEFDGPPPDTRRGYACDFRGANLEAVVFRRCSFENAIFDDTEQARFVVGRGGNKFLETIQWYKKLVP